MIVEGILHTSAKEEHGLEQMGQSMVTPLARAEDTGGQYSLLEVRDVPGGGPPMHRHTREDEAFYILEGEYEVHSQDGLVTRAGPGTFVHIRRGTAQAYRCLGPEPGRMLVLASPGGLERFFAELNALGAQPNFGAVAAVAGAHGIEVVGPPIQG
jgi:quercetin dioxygenase-like cupin family protein